MNASNQKHQIPWEAAGHLMRSPEQTLARGAIDAIGEKNYQKSRNIEDQCAVVSLQNLLNGIGCDIDADGAFGKGTQRALVRSCGYPEYVQGRDLPTLIEKLSARVAADIREDTSTPGTEGLSDEAKLIQAASNHEPFTTSPIPPHYCQADPVYCKMPDGKDRILGEKYTFKGSGCAVTAVSMIGSFLLEKYDLPGSLNPAELDDWLDNNNGYRGDGIFWPAAAELFSDLTGKNIKYDRIEGLSPAENIIRAKDLLIEWEWPIILAVQYVQQRKPRDIDHFVSVYATMNTNKGLQLRFMDPGRSRGGDSTHPDNTTLTTHRDGYIPKRLDFFRPA